MIHPDLDRWTAYVHGVLDASETFPLEGHLAGCAECRETVGDLQEEARILTREIASPLRLSALKARILEAAEGRRPGRSVMGQIPVAAALLVGLAAALLAPGARHHLTDGRVVLEDGKVLSAPATLDGVRSWEMTAVAKARFRLADRTEVDLQPGSRMSLAPAGPRGVEANLRTGEAKFSVAQAPKRLVIHSPAGSLEAADGTIEFKIVDREEGGNPMNRRIAGALVTVLAGSVSLSTSGGTAEAQAGQSVALVQAQKPVPLGGTQDSQETLLVRLEELAARVAKLEVEIAGLEAKNKELKASLQGRPSPAPGGAPGQPATVWFDEGHHVQVWSADGALPGSVQVELKEAVRQLKQVNPSKGEK